MDIKLYGDGVHDDTLALQAMLDNRGIATIEKVGTYLVSRALVIRSNTRLVMAPGARLLAAPMSRCSLIENEHFAGGGKDENIEIVGGIWDGNCDEMGLDGEEFTLARCDTPWSPESFRGKLMRFCNVDNIRIMGLTVRNPVSYGIQIGATHGFKVSDIFFDYNWHFGTTDGVHINGPARGGVIENLHGTTNDDLVSLTTYDECHAECSLGDIEQVYIHNITAINGYSGVRLLSGENYAIRDVRIDGLYGDFRHVGIVISNHNLRPGKVWFDNLVFENINCRKSHTPLTDDCYTFWDRGNIDKRSIIEFENAAVCGRVIVRDIQRYERETTQAAIISVDETCSIDRLLLDNIHQTIDNNGTAPTFVFEGKIGELIKRDVI